MSWRIILHWPAVLIGSTTLCILMSPPRGDSIRRFQVLVNALNNPFNNWWLFERHLSGYFGCFWLEFFRIFSRAPITCARGWDERRVSRDFGNINPIKNTSVHDHPHFATNMSMEDCGHLGPHCTTIDLDQVYNRRGPGGRKSQVLLL